MKNFSELLDTDLRIDIKISLSVISDNGYPRCKVSVNDLTQYNDSMFESLAVESTVRLLDPIRIVIEMSGKNHSREKETAIVIDSVTIDGFEILPNWTHLAQYENERCIDSPTSYLGFNGVWSLQINEPFYHWRHRITGQGWLLSPITT
jgi:hypothetical protein